MVGQTQSHLVKFLFDHSPWTTAHSSRVVRYAVRIGLGMGLTPGAICDLACAAFLHDIGKASIPSRILDKQIPLTSDEYDVMKDHVTIGVRIVWSDRICRRLALIIHQHHERYDGKGYPKGIASHTIKLAARILSVADTYDALVSDRPYRCGLSSQEAVGIIRQNSGTQFCPDVVEAFLLCNASRRSKWG